MEKFKTLEEAQAAFDSLSAENSDLVKSNDDLTKKAKKLAADCKEKDAIIAAVRGAKTAASKPSFVHTDNETYEIGVKSASWNKKIITAEQIASDKDLQKELIDAEVGFLTKVEK